MHANAMECDGRISCVEVFILQAAQLTTIEPVTAAILGSLLFHQPLYFLEILGIVMVVGSVVMMNSGD